MARRTVTTLPSRVGRPHGLTNRRHADRPANGRPEEQEQWPDGGSPGLSTKMLRDGLGRPRLACRGHHAEEGVEAELRQAKEAAEEGAGPDSILTSLADGVVVATSTASSSTSMRWPICIRGRGRRCRVEEWTDRWRRVRPTGSPHTRRRTCLARHGGGDGCRVLIRNAQNDGGSANTAAQCGPGRGG